MKLALKCVWLLLSVLAVLSLFMPGSAGIIAAIILLVLYLPLSVAANWTFGTFLNLLHVHGWGSDGDAQWLAVNVVLMLLLSGVGYLQWFVFFPRLWKTFRLRKG